ncbi:hypothetical protein [Treponema sp.]|uniref:hypothetical protein n=1 Tax=Treponema sp. TaxID=166 RepID=UPI00388ED8D8
MNKIHKEFFLLVLLSFLSINLHAIELGFKFTPSAVIPLATDNTIATGLSYGGTINADIDLFNFISLGPELSFFVVPKDGEQKQFFDYSIGANLGFYWAPVSRIMLSLNGAYGFNFAPYTYDGRLGPDEKSYLSRYEKKSFIMNNFYYKGTADISFRFSPNLTMGITGGYADYLYDEDKSITKGIIAGVSVRKIFDTRKRPNKIEIDLLQEDSLYPLFSFAYKSAPFAFAYVTNRNNAEIKDITVSFRADNYTSSAFKCKTIPILRKNKSAEIPITGDFSNALSTFTEDGMFNAELIIEYTLLGKKMTEVKEVVINTYKRNAFSWSDPNAIASLISPNDATVLEFTKGIIGIARDNNHTGINQNLESSMALFEALNTYGIIYEKDTLTPYDETHIDLDEIDTIQFPFQTINFKSGDCDDLAVLFSAMLSSVGIKSSIVFLPDDVVVGVNLNTSGKAASKLFSSLDRLIEIDGEIYLPLSMKSLKLGYYKAWSKALEEIYSAENADTVILEEAWKSYQSLGMTEKAFLEYINADKLRSRISAAYQSYQLYELVPLGKSLIKTYNENPTDENSNSVGMFYLRMGDYKNAKKWFGLGAAHNNISSLSNMGNIHLLEKEYNQAEIYFRKVLQLKPEHGGAKQGLERLKNQRGK